MPSDLLIADAARSLRRLAESSPTDATKLAEWYERASEFQVFLKAHPALSDVMPHFVYHYLADADIRAREPDYHDDQQTHILEIISELEN